MLKIRLQRIGRKNSPSYRVVVVDSRQSPKSGNFVDHLGSYNPKAGTFEINGDRAKDWLSKGAQASPTVHNMLVSKKIIDAAKITVIAPKKEVVKEEVKEAPVEEAPAEETAEAEVATEEKPAEATA